LRDGIVTKIELLQMQCLCDRTLELSNHRPAAQTALRAFCVLRPVDTRRPARQPPGVINRAAGRIRP